MFTRLLPTWPASAPEVRWGLREAFLCLVATQFLAAIWVGLLLGVGDGIGLSSSSVTFVLLASLALWAGYLAGPWLVSRRLGRGPRTDFDIGVAPAEAAVAIAVGVTLQLVLLPLLYWPITRLVDADPGASARELIDRIDGPVDVALLALTVVLGAPIVEEWFYRGMLLPALARSIGPTLGILGSSLIFALVHQNLITIPGLMLFGVAVAWLTATTGRIGPAIVAHMAFNATTVVQLLLER